MSSSDPTKDAKGAASAAPASSAPAAGATAVASPADTKVKGGVKKSKSAAGRRLWQVPLLIAGLVGFGFGVRAIAKAIKPVPFEMHVKDISELIKAKKVDAAIKQINVVSNHYGSKRELGLLSKLSGDAYFQATREEAGQNEENWKQMIEHYKIALSFGETWDVDVREHVGLAAMELGDEKLGVEQLEKVVEEDPERLPEHARALVGSYQRKRENGKAAELLEKLMEVKGLPLDERVWGTCKRIELVLGSGSAGELDKAVEMAQRALKEIPERNPAGTLLVWIGRAEFEAGRVDAAWKNLSDARSRFIGRTEDDGRAALILGKIAQGRKENGVALKLYQEVIAGHPGSSIQSAARLGRAEILAGDRKANEQMDGDYRAVIAELKAAEKKKGKGRPEMVGMEQVKTSLLTNYQAYQKEQRFADALKFMALMNLTEQEQSAANVYREAVSREKLGDELMEASRTAKDAAAGAAKREEALKRYGEAADAYLKHAELSTMDDGLYGDSLWKAAGLMDKSGRVDEAVKVYERFAVQRPRDPHEPQALFEIGQLYLAQGKFDEAIKYHERNRKENPKTPASYQSTVQLARCYIAKGVGMFKQAEDVLLELVQDNPNLLPSANEFRVALFALGELYYKWSDGGDGRDAENVRKRALAILRLEEAIERYPKDALVARSTFWLADCYRKSAGDVAAAIKADPQIAHREALEKAREERLAKAGSLYGEVIAALDKAGTAGVDMQVTGGLEEEYVRMSYVNRAECSFELEHYATSIKLYDDVATRYAQSLTAVEAYVQIVRAHEALKERGKAAAAAERARWILKRIPDEQFGRPPLGLTREYYERFLQVGKGPA